MKKLEKILGLMLLISIAMKLMHLQGTHVLMLISTMLLSLLYFALSFALLNDIRLKDIFKSSAYQHTNAKRILGAIGLGFALSNILIGTLFKLMLWQGANNQLLIGLGLLLVITSIAAIYYFRKPAAYYRQILMRAAVWGIAGMLMLQLSLHNLIDIYYGNDPEYAALYKKVIENPYDEELRLELNQRVYQQKREN